MKTAQFTLLQMDKISAMLYSTRRQSIDEDSPKDMKHSFDM